MKSVAREVPVFRRRQRRAYATMLGFEVLVVVVLAALARATGSAPALVVGGALFVGVVAFWYGQHLFRSVAPSMTDIRFDRRGATARTTPGIAVSVCWGPEVTVVRTSHALVGMTNGHAAFILGRHHASLAEEADIEALAAAGGSSMVDAGSAG